MSLANDNQLANTQHKLGLLEEQIRRARLRPATPENTESLKSLVQTANQLREEIVQYQALLKRRAS